MKADLSARLSRLKKVKSIQNIPKQAASASISDEEIKIPPGWTALDRDVWKREIRMPDPLANLNLSTYLAPSDIPREDWLFFDTETTGLSGGAGTTAFLIGLGRSEGTDFIMTQYFLRDYPGEPLMLNFLKEDFKRAGLLISYNGKSYDSPLLRTRFLMNRIPFEFAEQLDLLYPVRKLYRRTLPNCRLGTAETFLLQNPRQGDIPGSEIPDMWFNFLKDNNADSMSQVFEHNRLDIVRMADLLTYLENVLSHPEEQKPFRDLFALGRFLTERDNPLGIELLEQAIRKGDPRAEAYLSVYWKRRGEWDRAVGLWESILRKRSGLYAGTELAKYLEHHRKNLSSALIIVDRLLRELPIRDPRRKAELQHRRNRLLAKIRKQSENS